MIKKQEKILTPFKSKKGKEQLKPFFTDPKYIKAWQTPQLDVIQIQGTRGGNDMADEANAGTGIFQGLS